MHGFEITMTCDTPKPYWLERSRGTFRCKSIFFLLSRYGYLYSFITTAVPIYGAKVLGGDAIKNGVNVSVTWLMCWATSIAAGLSVPVLTNTGALTKTAVAKLYAGIVLIAAPLMLLGLAMAKCNVTLSKVFMRMSVILLGFERSSLRVNSLDLCPSECVDRRVHARFPHSGARLLRFGRTVVHYSPSVLFILQTVCNPPDSQPTSSLRSVFSKLFVVTRSVRNCRGVDTCRSPFNLCSECPRSHHFVNILVYEKVFRTFRASYVNYSGCLSTRVFSQCLSSKVIGTFFRYTR